MVAQVAPDREPAGPGERPVRQGGIGVVGLDLDRVPEWEDLVGQVKADLVESGDGSKAGVAEDEGSG
jgi:hypothetical protein